MSLSVSLAVCVSLSFYYLHVRLPLDVFSLNLIFEKLSKILLENKYLFQIWQ